MTPASYLPQDYDCFVGIDVDKNSFALTIKDHKVMKVAKKIPSNPEHLHNYIQKRHPHEKILYAYEAGPTGYHLYDYMTAQKQPCLVVSPNSIPKAPNEKAKNNRIDSEKLADYLKGGKLKSIRVPTGSYRELRHLVKVRDIYAKNRRVAKQRIKGLLLFAHLSPFVKQTDSKWSNCYIQCLKQIPCSDAVRQRLDMLLMDLAYARQQTLVIHRQLKAFCQKHADIKQYISYLQSIPGIGFITAVCILGKIGDPKNLKNVRELASFVGLVPWEDSTGDTVRRGSITHFGDHTLRYLLIEAAWVTTRHNIRLRQFFYRIKDKHHPSCAKQKAIVAVARKLTQIIYCVLKEQRMYLAC